MTTLQETLFLASSHGIELVFELIGFFVVALDALIEFLFGK